MSMNFWERLFLSPEWPLWQLIIGILIATFAISVILLVWKIIDNFREKKIMSSLLKGADKGLAKPANVSESDNIMEQMGQVFGSQANQIVSKGMEYSLINAANNQTSENQKTIKAPINFEGVGLHTGKKVLMTIYPASPNSGVIFKRVDIKKDNSI